MLRELGKVSAASVKKGTGRDWDEWVELLSKSGAESWTHQEIVAHLKKKYKLTAWWQQSVTIGFEIHIGKRVEGRNLKGEYSITATRTLDRPAQKVWELLNSPAGLAVWLKPMSEFKIKKGQTFESEGEIFGEVRTCKAPIRARIAWQETDWPKPSILQIYIVKRPKNRAILVFSHTGLMNVRSRDQLRAHWTQALSELKTLG